MRNKILCLILVVSLIFTGCGFWREQINQSVTFYYLCENYQKDLCCVIVSEEREASGHVGDLSYLLALYLMGPTNDEHGMPLPAGTQISAQINEGNVILELSNIAQFMSDLDFSLACACLSMTTLEIVVADSITIRCADKEITMDADSLTLYDVNSETIPVTEETS